MRIFVGALLFLVIISPLYWLNFACSNDESSPKTPERLPVDFDPKEVPEIDSRWEVLNRLKSSEGKERRTAARAVVYERDRFIFALWNLAKSASGESDVELGTKEAAIKLLGDLQAGEEYVVDFLLDNITFSPPGWDWDFSYIGGYPCVQALVKIGLPAANSIWARISVRRFNKKTLCLYALLLHNIYGLENDDCRALIEARLKKEGLSEQGKTNLKTLLKYVIKPNFPGGIPSESKKE